MGLADIKYAFGKAPAKHDDRTLKLKDILREADVLLAKDPLPDEYDFDDKHTEIPRSPPAYQNPPLNNCVIAGRAHQTVRFELIDQNRLINITDGEVELEFDKQTGGDRNKDIETLDSLKLWRTLGWEAAGQHFKIKAFAKLDPDNHEQILKMIYINLGVALGFFLPDSARIEFDAGKSWEATRDRARGDRGHYVYVPGYTKQGPVCITWGRKQQMSWAFVEKYCDEAYVIIDDVNTPEKKRTLDKEKLNKFLATCAPVVEETEHKR